MKIRRHVLIDCFQPWIDGEDLREIAYIAGGKQGQPGGHSVILIHRIFVLAKYVKGYQRQSPVQNKSNVCSVLFWYYIVQ